MSGLRHFEGEPSHRVLWQLISSGSALWKWDVGPAAIADVLVLDTGRTLEQHGALNEAVDRGLDESAQSFLAEN